MGEKYQFRLSWTELFWKRSREQNIAIGRQLVQKNPEVIREQLVDKLSEMSC